MLTTLHRWGLTLDSWMAMRGKAMRLVVLNSVPFLLFCLNPPTVPLALLLALPVTLIWSLWATGDLYRETKEIGYHALFVSVFLGGILGLIGLVSLWVPSIHMNQMVGACSAGWLWAWGQNPTSRRFMAPAMPYNQKPVVLSKKSK